MRLILLFGLFWFVPMGFCLEVSPAEIKFSGNTGEVLCGNISVGGVESFVVVEDRWAERGFDGRDFLSHDGDAGDLGLRLEYEREFVLSGEAKRLVCVRGESSGFYHGLLLFRGEEENSGVGVWVVVELVGADVISFGGMSVEVIEDDSGVSDIFLTMLIVLLIVFFVLFCLEIEQTLTLKKEDIR